jgi:hypothetical protein
MGSFGWLGIELDAGVMMTMVMVAVMNYHHDLRLRRIGYCEAEDEHET